jgi:hypothetical protein
MIANAPLASSTCFKDSKRSRTELLETGMVS